MHFLSQHERKLRSPAANGARGSLSQQERRPRQKHACGRGARQAPRFPRSRGQAPNQSAETERFRARGCLGCLRLDAWRLPGWRTAFSLLLTPSSLLPGWPPWLPAPLPSYLSPVARRAVSGSTPGGWPAGRRGGAASSLLPPGSFLLPGGPPCLAGRLPGCLPPASRQSGRVAVSGSTPGGWLAGWLGSGVGVPCLCCALPPPCSLAGRPACLVGCQAVFPPWAANLAVYFELKCRCPHFNLTSTPTLQPTPHLF